MAQLRTICAISAVGRAAMKWAVGIIVVTWLLCGLIGAWRLDDLSPKYWQVIAEGPISLARAYNENPVEYPGPS